MRILLSRIVNLDLVPVGIFYKMCINPNPVIRKKRLIKTHKRILKEGQILMTYATEKFAGNSKMTSVCLNHKLNKNV